MMLAEAGAAGGSPRRACFAGGSATSAMAAPRLPAFTADLFVL